MRFKNTSMLAGLCVVSCLVLTACGGGSGQSQPSPAKQCTSNSDCPDGGATTTPDAGSTDTNPGAPDTSTTDATTDSGTTDAGTPDTTDSGTTPGHV